MGSSHPPPLLARQGLPPRPACSHQSFGEPEELDPLNPKLLREDRAPLAFKNIFCSLEGGEGEQTQQ